MMTTGHRIAVAFAIVVLDLAFFVLPLSGLFAAYVIVARPEWFRGWIEGLYESGGPNRDLPDDVP
jgi:hypothetical protein